MSLVRILFTSLALMGAVAATPASAQFFLRNPDLTGAPMRGDEADIGYALPGATPAELHAGMVWATRAALNVAALQCQFEPTLMTVDNYNAILVDHKSELMQSLNTLTAYFTRMNGKNKARGITALDRFGTRLYSSFSTVSAQYIFCLTASSIARDAVFTPRGKFGDIAISRMRELRNSLRPAGEQQFPGRRPLSETLPAMPDPNCWDKRNRWNTKRCGRQPG